MYKVIHQFLDLQDENHHYKVGDAFPRNGKKVTAKRISELSGSENKIHKPLIEKIEIEKAKAVPKKRTRK